jgi:hypothetical protein
MLAELIILWPSADTRLHEDTALAEAIVISGKAENTVPRRKIGLASPYEWPAMNDSIPNKFY